MRRYLIALILSLSISSAWAHSANDDPALNAWFSGLKQPSTGANCCSVKDCRPVRVRVGAGGAVEVFIDRKNFGPHAPDDWSVVSNDVILRQEQNPIGEPVACFWNGRVACFVDASGS